MSDNYFRNINTLARCQNQYDRMEAPEYYEEEVIDDEEGEE